MGEGPLRHQQSSWIYDLRQPRRGSRHNEDEPQTGAEEIARDRTESQAGKEQVVISEQEQRNLLTQI
jgi:hypothetical protein